MSKIAKNIILFVIILALLGVGFWWLLFYTPADSSQGNENNQPQIEEVYKKAEEDVREIELTLPENKLVFVKSGDSWGIEGENAEKISLSKVESFVASALNIYSREKITENIESCGFESPSAVISVIGTDGKTDIITLGAKSAMADKVFFNVNGGDVWTMSASLAESLTADLGYYRSFKRLSINQEEIYDVEVKRAKNTYRITKTGETWLITDPFSTGYHINYDFINDEILALIAGLDLTTPVDMMPVSIDSSYKPSVVTVLSAPVLSDGARGDRAETVLFIGRTEGDKTYVEYDGEVFAVDKNALSFVDANEMHIVSKLLALTDVKTVHSVKVNAKDAVYNLEVLHTDIAMAEDETSFELNGKSVDQTEARQAYVQIISLQLDDSYKGQKIAELLAEVQFETTDGTKTITFNKIDEFISTFTVNGSTEFVIKNSKVQTMLDAFAELLQNSN